jgi:hypothetical protein
MTIIAREGILRVRYALWAEDMSSLCVERQESEVAVEFSAGDYDFFNISGEVKQLPRFSVCHHEPEIDVAFL